MSHYQQHNQLQIIITALLKQCHAVMCFDTVMLSHVLISLGIFKSFVWLVLLANIASLCPIIRHILNIVILGKRNKKKKIHAQTLSCSQIHFNTHAIKHVLTATHKTHADTVMLSNTLTLSCC